MPESDEGKRIDLTNCIFCPFREDDICMVYQQALGDKSKKPGYCRYIAIIMGKDVDNG
jgi:hypothetical protein